MAYFNYDRKRWAIEDIVTCYECAEKAGFKDKLFINFGLLLGIIREYDFIANDDDVDMSVLSDDITVDQQNEYINLLDKNGMFFARKKMAYRKDNGRVVWFTLRRQERRAKFCHWFGFTWQNIWWWSKGSRWVRPSKFNVDRWNYDLHDEGIALGVPADIITELMWIKFKDIKVRIPVKFGSVLDWEYPGWPVPQGGSSRKNIVCIIPKWDNPHSWRVKLNLVL